MSGPAEQDIEARGTLAVEDAVGVVRIEMLLRAPTEDVWDAVTRPDRLAGWYGTIEGDLHVGGSYHAVLIPSGWDGTAAVLECDSGRRLVIEGAEPGKPPVRDELQLTRTDSGSTRVVLTKRGVDVAMIAAYGVGTQIHLENLAAHLAGRGPIDPEPYWEQLLPRYEELAVERWSPAHDEP